MKNDKIRFIKRHCFVDFNIGNIQKQYKRNGDLIFKENFTKRTTSSENQDFESGLGTWDYNSNTGILYYLSENGEGFDITNLDLYSLIKIDTDTDGYLFASIPYNIIDDVSFEIDDRGIFIINDNN